jgi:hypothetical protein
MRGRHLQTLIARVLGFRGTGVLRAAGRDFVLYKLGVLTGADGDVHSRQLGSARGLAWRSDLAAQGGEGLSTW